MPAKGRELGERAFLPIAAWPGPKRDGGDATGQGTDDGRRTAASVQYPDGPEALFTAALPQVVEFVASPAGSAPTISP